MVNSAVYKKIGKKAVKTSAIIKAGSRVTIYDKMTIKGVTYYEIGKDQYIKTANVDGKLYTLAKSTSLYTRNGKVIKGSKIAKGKQIITFGKVITIHGKKFYATKHGHVPVKAFDTQQDIPNPPANTDPQKPNTDTTNSTSNTNSGELYSRTT